MRTASTIVIIAAALSLGACHKKPTGPTTGDGIPVDINASNASNVSVTGNAI